MTVITIVATIRMKTSCTVDASLAHPTLSGALTTVACRPRGTATETKTAKAARTSQKVSAKTRRGPALATFSLVTMEIAYPGFTFVMVIMIVLITRTKVKPDRYVKLLVQNFTSRWR